MDEMFEILTLLQTQKASPLPVVLFGKSYWRSVVNFSALFEHGMVSIEDLALFEIVDNAEQAWEFAAAARPERAQSAESASRGRSAARPDPKSQLTGRASAEPCRRHLNWGTIP